VGPGCGWCTLVDPGCDNCTVVDLAWKVHCGGPWLRLVHSVGPCMWLVPCGGIWVWLGRWCTTVNDANRIPGFPWNLSFLKLEEPITDSAIFCTLPHTGFIISPAWKSVPRSTRVLFSMLGSKISPLFCDPGNLAEDSVLGKHQTSDLPPSPLQE
jgi:hypothetical protein